MLEAPHFQDETLKQNLVIQRVLEKVHELEMKLAAGEEKSGLQGFFGNEDINKFFNICHMSSQKLLINRFFAFLDTALGLWVIFFRKSCFANQSAKV